MRCSSTRMWSWISFSIARRLPKQPRGSGPASEEGRIEAFVSVITPVNVFYVARKLRNVTTARQLVESLLSTCEVCAPDRAALLAALRLPGKDYEDAVQVVSAQSAALDALVTRDPAGYEGLSFAVFSPASFLEVLAGSQ